MCERKKVCLFNAFFLLLVFYGSLVNQLRWEWIRMAMKSVGMRIVVAANICDFSIECGNRLSGEWARKRNGSDAPIKTEEEKDIRETIAFFRASVCVCCWVCAGRMRVAFVHYCQLQLCSSIVMVRLFVDGANVQMERDAIASSSRSMSALKWGSNRFIICK